MAPKKPSLEESPLLSNRSMSMHSTINPNKLEQARFTEIREMESEGGNSARIIIYVVIIIAVGVGAALLIRNIISNNQTPQTTNNPTSFTQTQTTNSAFVLSKNPSADSTALNAPKTADYSDSALVTLGESTGDASKLSLDKIFYNRFATFARVTFDLTSSDKKLVKTTLNFDSVGKKLTVAFDGLQTIASGLKQDLTVGDIVNDIRYIQTNNNFVLMFSEKVKYVAKVDGDNLIIDIKTEAELAKPETTTPTTQTPAPAPQPTPAATDSGAPAAPHYDNSYSQDKQYVSSKVNTNKLNHNTYFFDNYGSSWEFSWAQKNAVGDDVVPNAVAYYDTSTAGKTFLIVEISNISRELFNNNGVTSLTANDIQNKTGVTTSGQTLVKVELVSFANGVAKYKFELSKKTDYKLWVDKTVDGTTGTISITVKD